MAAGDLGHARTAFENLLADGASSPFLEMGARMNLALVFGLVKMEAEARIEVEKALELAPWISVSAAAPFYQFKDPAVFVRYSEIWRRLGVPGE